MGVASLFVLLHIQVLRYDKTLKLRQLIFHIRRYLERPRIQLRLKLTELLFVHEVNVS